MAGRSRTPGAEIRTERTTVRWTKSEKQHLERVQQEQGISYLVDVPRIMTLRQLRIEEVVDTKAETLEQVREAVGLKSAEDVLLMTLKQAKLTEVIGDGAESLEKARRVLGFKSTEEALWALAKAQLERMSSTLEKDVAE
jgi:hypothetical protein